MRWKWIVPLAATALWGQSPDPLAAAKSNDIASGKKVFDSQCALCHGIGGTGGRGPALTKAKMRHAADGSELIGVIVGGVNGSSMPAFWFLGERPVFQVAAYVRSLSANQPAETLAGDPVQGKALYAAKGCTGCHVANGEGRAYGPELTEIGTLRSATFLRESILDPEASVPEGFAVVKATPRTGTAVIGIRLNEDSFTIQLRDAAGRFHSFRKQDLAELKKDLTTSPMPSYRDKLSSAEVDDLVAYLASLKERQ
jgi:putative heme-binding domain-containing protein